MSDLDQQNRAATLQALQELNARYSDLESRAQAQYAEARRLYEEVVETRRERVEQACRKFGSGPTVR